MTKRSSMRLSNVFEHSWLQVYRRYRQVLWGEIIQLNANVFVMKKIASFPFELFWQSDRHFWDITFNSMFDSSVLIVNRICIDDDTDVLTLLKFAKEIRENLVATENRQEFDKEMKRVDFKKKFRGIKRLFKNERNNRIAHFNQEQNTNLRKLDLSPRRTLISELKPTTLLINDLFQVLCLGQHHMPTFHTYYSDYSDLMPSMNRDKRSDVERLLDLVARDNPLLNMPEKEAGYWPMHKENLSKDAMATLNSYRKKFGLPEVG